MPRAKWYIGFRWVEELEAFSSLEEPTYKSHGRSYGAVIGPFHTERAAIWGAENPFGWLTVLEAEARAKQAAIHCTQKETK